MKPKLSDQILLAHQIAVAQEAGTPLDWEYSVPDGKINMLRDQMNPAFCLMHGYEISIKPWALGDSVNGHALSEGQRWHLQGKWTAGSLPGKTRPLTDEECHEPGDEYWDARLNRWVVCSYTCSNPASTYDSCYRTKRPLPSIPAPTKMVPLGAKDVPPGSILRWHTWEPYEYRVPLEVYHQHVGIITGGKIELLTFEGLMFDRWLISRDGGKTWNPCSKPAV